MIQNIPSYEDHDDNIFRGQQDKQLFQFPTQLNEFGQRTNSGVSLIRRWDDPRIALQTLVTVADLVLVEEEQGQGSNTLLSCTAVKFKDLETNVQQQVNVAENGLVVLCARAATPQILMKYNENLLQNPYLGQGVSDHFAMPMGLYVPPTDLKVSSKDVSAPVFATMVWKASQNGFPDGIDTVVGFDFFTGNLQKLLYLTSHLFLAFLPNSIKSPL